MNSGIFKSLLKNIGCSYCHDTDFETDKKLIEKDLYVNWSLYLKEYDLYSAMILYNKKYDKDVSELIMGDQDTIILIDKEKKVCLKLEYVIKNEKDKTSILVPLDEYQDFYQKIEDMKKIYDKKLKAYFIGDYDIQF